MADKKVIFGVDGLKGKFLELRQDMVHKTSLRMVAAAGSVLKKEAKAIALSKGLKKSGAMIRNIAIKRERDVPPGTQQYHLGVRHKWHFSTSKKRTRYLAMNDKTGKIYSRVKEDPSYWSFVEFGHKIVPRASGGNATGETRYVTTLRNGKKANRIRKHSIDSLAIRRRNALGFVEPKPFLAPALTNKKQEAIAAMEDRLLKDLAKASK